MFHESRTAPPTQDYPERRRGLAIDFLSDPGQRLMFVINQNTPRSRSSIADRPEGVEFRRPAVFQVSSTSLMELLST
jgi:hypothetical protein